MDKCNYHCNANIKSEWVTLSVEDGTQMQVFVAKPMETTQAPALIVLQEAYGVNSHIQHITQRFSEAGFFAVAPELFHRTAGDHFEVSYDNPDLAMSHMNALEEETLQADLRAVDKFCRTHPQARRDWLASVGFCMGGRVSFIANATLKLQAAVSFYGGRISPQYLTLAAKQHGPLLLIWGGLDKHIGFENQRMINDALHKANKNFVDIEFSQADHGFFCDNRKSYHPIAAKQAWALTLAFLNS